MKALTVAMHAYQRKDLLIKISKYSAGALLAYQVYGWTRGGRKKSRETTKKDQV